MTVEYHTNRSVSDSEQAPPRRFLSLTSPFASSATQRPATPFLWRRSPVGRNGSELERHMDDLNRELQQDVEDTDSRDALTRLTDLSRDYARLEVYYEEVHRRYSEAKGEIGRLREEVNVLEGTLAARERRIKTLKQALKVRRH